MIIFFFSNYQVVVDASVQLDEGQKVDFTDSTNMENYPYALFFWWNIYFIFMYILWNFYFKKYCFTSDSQALTQIFSLWFHLHRYGICQTASRIISFTEIRCVLQRYYAAAILFDSIHKHSEKGWGRYDVNCHWLVTIRAERIEKKE